MEPLFLTLAGAAAAAAGVRLFSWWWSTEQVTKRALRSRSSVPIAEARARSRVKVVGRVVAVGEPLSAPITGRPCVHWQLVIESKQRSGKSDLWVEVLRRQGVQDFFVADETGRALVRPGESWQFAAEADRAPASPAAEIEPRLWDFLRAELETIPEAAMGTRLRCREGVYEIGEEVAVIGRATLEPDPDPPPERAGSYREPPKRLCLDPSAKLPLLASDDPKTFGR